MTDCPQPGCSGAVEDEYCNRCGYRYAPVTPVTRPTSAAPGTTGSSGSSGNHWLAPHPGERGAGAAALPATPAEDPTAAVLADPEVPEHKRYCADPDCHAPVGRSRNGRPGRVYGYCSQCGRPFSFRPPLAPGDLVAGQYQVHGALAHGGLGWVYLARDRQVDQWVVLKGLRDPDLPSGRHAVGAELEALAHANHPNIVTVYNRVQHPHPRTGENVDYIVMEYVSGRSLAQIHHEQRELGEPLSLAQVCGCILHVLPALAHLHNRGLLYCDFKPHNVIVSADRVRLIDLGAVRRMDDDQSPLWGTPGYQDPEIATHGLSIATDLYAVARTMAVLSFDFPGFSQERQGSLPSPDEVAELAENESYYRLLRRATHSDPAQRFSSAAEMAEQLEGVLREVLAHQDGKPRPATSTLFGPELAVVGADPDTFPTGGTDPVTAALALPDRQVDPDDPQAGLLLTVGPMSLEQRLRALSEIAQPSLETRLRAIRSRLELGAVDSVGAVDAVDVVRTELAALERQHPGDWRIRWTRGLTALIGGKLDNARDAFDAVFDRFPGEAAPKLALAVCAEHRGDHHTAAHYYDVVWRTDRTYLGAAFGLARARFALGDRAGMTAALAMVPETARYGVTARLCAILGRGRDRDPAEPLVADYFEAATQLDTLDLDVERHWRAVAEVLETALSWLLAGRPGSAEASGQIPDALFGYPLSERGLRQGLEQAYRALARLAATPAEGIRLVDRANSVRARSWV